MRPLYDRYRAVKRVCSGGGVRERESSSSASLHLVTPLVSSSAGMGSAGDSLPSVTLLQSSLTQSGGVSIKLS